MDDLKGEFWPDLLSLGIGFGRAEFTSVSRETRF